MASLGSPWLFHGGTEGRLWADDLLPLLALFLLLPLLPLPLLLLLLLPVDGTEPLDRDGGGRGGKLACEGG